MQIRGKEVDFKISRLEDAARMEQALEHMEETEQKIQAEKTGKLTTILRLTLDMFRDFFKEATGEDILRDCGDVEEAKDTYLAFLQEVGNQKEAVMGFALDDIK